MRVLMTGEISKLEKLCPWRENEENSQLSNLNAARTDKKKTDEMKVA